MSTDLAQRPSAADLMEQVLIKGDLSKLTAEERSSYYMAVCQSVGLNPLTKPFEFIVLNGRLTLYALKAATDQLRQIHGVSVTKIEREMIDDLFVVTVYVRDRDGREDSDVGVVALAKLQGEAKANAILKAVTKGKRRATLSICGLGMLDEAEIESIPEARTQPAQQVGRTQEPRALPPGRETAGERSAKSHLQDHLGELMTRRNQTAPETWADACAACQVPAGRKIHDLTTAQIKTMATWVDAQLSALERAVDEPAVMEF